MQFEPVQVFVLEGTAAAARRTSGRVGQELSGHRVFRGADFVQCPGGDDFATPPAGAGPEVDDPRGAAHGFLVVFDHKERVALFDQFFEGVEQVAVVAFVESDGRLIQHVKNASEVRAELGGKTDALGLAAGEGGGGTVEGEVVEADPLHEAEALPDFGEDVGGKDAVVLVENEGVEQLGRVAGAGAGEVGNGTAMDADIAGLGVEAEPPAFGAGPGDVFVGFLPGLLLLEIGLELRAGLVGLDLAVIDQPEPAAGLAPAVGGVEGEHARVERFEGAGAGRAGHFGAE